MQKALSILVASLMVVLLFSFIGYEVVTGGAIFGKAKPAAETRTPPKPVKPTVLWNQQDIVYMCGHGDLCAIHHSGALKTTILDGPAWGDFVQNPQWSPTGNHVAYERLVYNASGYATLSLNVISKTGTITELASYISSEPHEQLVDFAGAPVWSADGDFISTTVETSHFLYENPDGSKIYRVTHEFIDVYLNGTVAPAYDLSEEDFEVVPVARHPFGGLLFVFLRGRGTWELRFREKDDKGIGRLITQYSENTTHLRSLPLGADFYCDGSFFIFENREVPGSLWRGYLDGTYEKIIDRQIGVPAISGGPSRNAQPAMDPMVVFNNFDDFYLYLYDYGAGPYPSNPWRLTEAGEAYPEGVDFKVTNWPCVWSD